MNSKHWHFFLNSKSGAQQTHKLKKLVVQHFGERAKIHDLHLDNPKAILDNLPLGDEVVACGGDGTVRWLAELLLEKVPPRPPLGIIPFGTGNDLARALGISLNIEQALKSLENAKTLHWDFWWVHEKSEREKSEKKLEEKKTEENLYSAPKLMLNYFSAGFDAEAAYRFDAHRKQKPEVFKGGWINRFWYAWHSFLAQNKKVAFCIRPNIEKEKAFGLVILNIGSYAGGFVPPLKISPDDALLNYFSYQSRWDFSCLLSGLKRKDPALFPSRKSFEIIFPEPCWAQLDGEPFLLNPCELEFKHGGKLAFRAFV